MILYTQSDIFVLLKRQTTGDNHRARLVFACDLSGRNDHIFVSVFSTLLQMEGICFSVDVFLAIVTLSKEADLYMSVKVYLSHIHMTYFAECFVLSTRKSRVLLGWFFQHHLTLLTDLVLLLLMQA
jgi:hypothetical protein